MQDLTANLNKLHTTPMGVERVRRNLGLQINDVVSWCKEAVQNADLLMQAGKNWYVYKGGVSITINAKSFNYHRSPGKLQGSRHARIGLNVSAEVLLSSDIYPEGGHAAPKEHHKQAGVVSIYQVLRNTAG
jgi:hypothetical protein